MVAMRGVRPIWERSHLRRHDEVRCVAQIYGGVQLERRAARVKQAQSTGCHRHMDLHLDAGEDLTDAVARARSKRHLASSGCPSERSGENRQGSKRSGSVPQRRISLNEVGRDVDLGARGDRMIAKMVIRYRTPGYQPEWRIETQRLLDDLSRKWRARKVTHRRWPGAGANAVELTVELRLGIRVLREQIPDPVQGERGGLVPRDHKRDHLADELALRHGGSAVHIIRGHEHTQDIWRIPARTLRWLAILATTLRKGRNE